MSAIDKLAKLASGFRAPFTTAREDWLGLSLLTDDDGDEALIATLECDDHVAVAFVDLLNAIAPALAEVAALQAEVARHKTAAGPAESVHAALGVSNREAARAAMAHGVPCPTCGAESHTEAKGAVAADRELDNPRHPAPCVHLDRAHDGSCFGCGSDENNPNPEATP